MAKLFKDVRFTRAFGILGVFIILLSCWYVSLCVISADDIREAVLRYQNRDHRMGEVIFVSIDGKDPSEVFLKRFEKELGPLKKGSLCCEMRPKPPRVRYDNLGNAIDTVTSSVKYAFDKETGESAVVLFTGSIIPIGFHTVRVYGGYYCGELCAGGGYYRVVRRNGHWEVEEFEQVWVSQHLEAENGKSAVAALK